MQAINTNFSTFHAGSADVLLSHKAYYLIIQIFLFSNTPVQYGSLKKSPQEKAMEVSNLPNNLVSSLLGSETF